MALLRCANCGGVGAGPLLALRRQPRKENLLGVKWTEWMFPSLVARAVYRKFAPRPKEVDSQASRTAYYR